MENPALSLARFCAKMARQEARDLENEAYERDIDNAFDAIQMPFRGLTNEDHSGNLESAQ